MVVALVKGTKDAGCDTMTHTVWGDVWLTRVPAALQIQAGCTAVVAVVKGNELWVANAGDSRAVLCRKGQALALSEDHKPQSEAERNRITAAGGFVSDVGGVSRRAPGLLSLKILRARLMSSACWPAPGHHRQGCVSAVPT